MTIIERELSPTQKEEFVFFGFDNVFVLSAYFLMEKKPGKRKYEVLKRWDRIEKRLCNCEEPTLTSQMIADVREKFMSTLLVFTSEQWKNRKK